MRFGLPISLMAHGLFIAGGIFMFGRNIPLLDEGNVVAVEVLTISEFTNIRAAVKQPKPKEPAPEPEEPMQLETPMENAELESDAIEKRQDDASEKEPDPEPEPIKKAELEEAVPQEPEDEKPKPPEKPAFDLDALSDIVNRTRDAAPEKNQQVALQSEKNVYEYADIARTASGEGTGLSVTLLDKLQTEMMRCWRESRDAVDPESLVVQFRLRLLPDGYVEKVELLGETGSGPYAAVARQRAAAAIKKCEPYDFLPAENYSGWKDMTLSFRPRA